MKLAEKQRAQASLKECAKQTGLTEEEIRKEIQLTLDDAWEKSRRDPASKAKWDELFPDGKKPSIEAFIVRLGQTIPPDEANSNMGPESFQRGVGMKISITEYLKSQRTIWLMASQMGCSMLEARRITQATIDRAWERTWQPGNLQAQWNWQTVFHSPEKPTVDEFFVGMGRGEVEAGREPPWLL